VIKLLFSTLFIILINVKYSNAHGRLIEPPSRASAWRYGFNTPENYNVSFRLMLTQCFVGRCDGFTSNITN
jgi:hypothetical protein